ncbi:hypothetical protein [Calidifontibacillus erzurumensis]|uniref:hypothetical protein n=1 Tax=Calidifontibacillus erzurumensis TaxID=2741433 RepID=UPI0035B54A74
MLTYEERKKHYPLLKMTPLQIKVFLSTPLVFPKENIHLDALLTNIVAKECFGHDPDRWQNQDKHVEIPLPLAKTEGIYPIWKASVAFSSPLHREHQDIWVKRTYDEFAGYKSNKIVWPAGVIGPEIAKPLAKDGVHLEKATGPANPSESGGFKSYFEHRNLIVTDYLLFHAYGNKDEVTRLLTQIKGIGKKTAIGYGKVKNVEVKEVEQDYSLFTPEGKPSRLLPVEDFSPIHARMVAAPSIPPYWSKRNLIIQYAPTSSLPIWEWEKKESNPSSFEDDWFDDEIQTFSEEEWFDD